MGCAMSCLSTHILNNIVGRLAAKAYIDVFKDAPKQYRTNSKGNGGEPGSLLIDALPIRELSTTFYEPHFYTGGHLDARC